MILIDVQKMYKTCYSSIYLGTTKGSTRMILVHVQKMYKTCYSSSLFVFSKKSYLPRRKKKIRDNKRKH